MNKNWKERWEKIVKEDGDFDYSYLDDLVFHKLELMYNFYSNTENTSNTDEKNKEICDQIKEILDLREKTEHHFYHEKSSAFYDKHCKTIIEEPEDRFYSKVSAEWDSDDNRLKYIEMSEAECAEEDADNEKMYALIGKYRRNWWD